MVMLCPEWSVIVGRQSRIGCQGGCHGPCYGRCCQSLAVSDNVPSRMKKNERIIDEIEGEGVVNWISREERCILS